MNREILALFALIAVAPAHGQVRCTMPNGVVITQQLGNCPSGAVKAQAADGTPIAIPAPAPKPAPAPVRSAPATAAPQPTPAARPPAPSQPTDYEYARVICKAFEQAGATTCDVQANVLSDSKIEVTLATSPASAVLTCNDVAASMRAKTRAFDERNWRILIYSPFSGNRPIANCKL